LGEPMRLDSPAANKIIPMLFNEYREFSKMTSDEFTNDECTNARI
jgi:hypothetical protein